MSKGLGKNYLSPAMKQWHLSDLENRIYCNTEDNKKITMPRYYKDKIYDENQRAQIASSFVEKMGIEIEKFNNDPDYNKNFHAREAAIIAAFNRESLKSTQNNKI
jgi:hypothetical protein